MWISGRCDRFLIQSRVGPGQLPFFLRAKEVYGPQFGKHWDSISFLSASSVLWFSYLTPSSHHLLCLVSYSFCPYFLCFPVSHLIYWCSFSCSWLQLPSSTEREAFLFMWQLDPSQNVILALSLEPFSYSHPLPLRAETLKLDCLYSSSGSTSYWQGDPR